MRRWEIERKEREQREERKGEPSDQLHLAGAPTADCHGAPARGA